MKDKPKSRVQHLSNNYKKNSKSCRKNRPDTRRMKSHQMAPQPQVNRLPVIHESPKSLCGRIQDIHLFDESSIEMPQSRTSSSPSELNNKNKSPFIDKVRNDIILVPVADNEKSRSRLSSLPSSPNPDVENEETLNSSICPGSENETSSSRLPFFGSSTHPNVENETRNCETADEIGISNDIGTLFRQVLNLNTMNDEGNRTSQRQLAATEPFCVEPGHSKTKDETKIFLETEHRTSTSEIEESITIDELELSLQTTEYMNCHEETDSESTQRSEATEIRYPDTVHVEHDEALTLSCCPSETEMAPGENPSPDNVHVEHEEALSSCPSETEVAPGENPSPDNKTPTNDLTDEQLRMLFDGDEDGDNLLHMSILHDKEDTARLIIEAAPDVTFLNRCNTLGQTPLHIAVVVGQSRMVRRLICAGAQVDLPEERGYTALHLACGLGQLDIVQQLTTPIAYEETLNNNFQIPYQRIPQDLELRNRQGQTCLHLAVIHRRPEIVSLLLQIGADVNAAHGKTGRSALHLAVDNENVEMVALLLKDKNVKVDLPDFDGLTAFQLALDSGHHEIQRLLILSGASNKNLPGPEEYEEIIIDLSAKPILKP